MLVILLLVTLVLFGLQIRQARLEHLIQTEFPVQTGHPLQQKLGSPGAGLYCRGAGITSAGSAGWLVRACCSLP